MLTLTIDQRARVDLAVTDRAGNPAKLDGIPVWESSNEDFVTVEPAEDGMSAWVVSSDEFVIEAVMVTVRADGDLGEGVRSIIGTLPVFVTAGEAVQIELTAGAPQPKA